MSHTCQREVNEIGSASTKLHRRFRAAFSLAVSVGGGGEVSAVALAAALIAGQMGSQPHKVAVAAVVVVVGGSRRCQRPEEPNRDQAPEVLAKVEEVRTLAGQ